MYRLALWEGRSCNNETDAFSIFFGCSKRGSVQPMCRCILNDQDVSGSTTGFTHVVLKTPLACTSSVKKTVSHTPEVSRCQGKHVHIPRQTCSHPNPKHDPNGTAIYAAPLTPSQPPLAVLKAVRTGSPVCVSGSCKHIGGLIQRTKRLLRLCGRVAFWPESALRLQEARAMTTWDGKRLIASKPKQTETICSTCSIV